jgi:hypothetical protein
MNILIKFWMENKKTFLNQRFDLLSYYFVIAFNSLISSLNLLLFILI